MKLQIEQTGRIPASEEILSRFYGYAAYAVDESMYAEMLENGNFQASGSIGDAGAVREVSAANHAWAAYPAGADVHLKIKNDRPLFAENPNYLRITATAPGQGVCNCTCGGLSVRKGVVYRVTFYARSYDYKGKAEAALAFDGEPVTRARVRLRADGNWHLYTLRMKSRTAVEGAEFTFTLLKAGTVHVDDLSLFPEDALFGVFRRDLAQALRDLKPKYLVYPRTYGGEGMPCFRWKNTVGMRERRRYGVDLRSLGGAKGGHGCGFCGQTVGIGYYEFLRLNEYVGASPVPVLSMRSVDADWESEIQDVLDAAEFAVGGDDTMWGKVRKEMGHARPFELRHLCLNVEGENAARLLALTREKLAERYPGISVVEKLSSAAGLADGVFARDVGACPLHGEEDALSFDRECSAAEKGCLTPLAGADALVRIEHSLACETCGMLPVRTQEAPALVLFDGASVRLTTHYYIWLFCNLCTGERMLPASCEGLTVSASETESTVYVKFVNLSEEAKSVEAGEEAGELTRILVLPLGRGDAVPEDVAPASAREAEIPAGSMCVLVFRKPARK